MKVATLCQAGSVRSAGLKHLLNYKYNHDALSCGWEGNSKETLKMLFTWADYIVITQGEFIEYVPEEFHGKTFCYDVGEDTYGYAFHPELIKKFETMIKQHGFFNK